MKQAWEVQKTALEVEVNAGDPDAPLKLEVLENEMAQAEFEEQQPIPYQLTNKEKMKAQSKWCTYCERKSHLEEYQGQAFSLILGQCTQLLKDKMKQDTDWTPVSMSYQPLRLYRLIKKTILAQTEDQYPVATVYNEEFALYSFCQETRTNAEWYERFNTKVDLTNAIGVTQQHKVLLEWVAQETHTCAYTALIKAQQKAVREDAEESYLAYCFLRQSGKQHSTLKMDLQNDFTTRDN